MTETRPAPRSGEQERHLALSTVAQQGTYVVSTVAMLAVITALARTLSLSEFGVYGLTVAVSGYLLVAQGAVEAATQRALAQTTTPEARDRAFSLAVFVYCGTGLAIGAVIAGGGNLLVGAFNIPAHLHHDARLGLAVLGLVTAVGWPLKTFQDALRGEQRFATAAVSEAIAYVIFSVVLLAMLAAGAPLWALIGASGAIPPLIGAVSLIQARRGGLGLRYRHRSWDRAELHDFLAVSRGLLWTSLADLFIYGVDRIVLGLFRPAATVALYEGPVRPHNLVRQIQSVLGLVVLPAGARYLAEGDEARVRDLIVRGIRYTALVLLPIVVMLMALAQPILEAWIGHRYAGAATAMTILLVYWLVAINSNVAGNMIIAAGHIGAWGRYAWSVALLNLALSLALTPWLGLNGVVLGTTIPYLVTYPAVIWMLTRWLPVTVGELVREAWLPAYAVAAVTGVVLLAVRLAVDPHALWLVLLIGGAGVLGAWALTYAAVLRPAEKLLIRDVVGHVVWRLVPRRAA